MTLKNTVNHYGSGSCYLHGILLVLFLGMLCLGVSFSYMPKSELHSMMNIHKLSGLLTLSLSILFLVWSLFNIKPRYHEQMPMYEKALAEIVRISLYIMMLIMPLSGWIMVTAAGKYPYIGDFSFPCPLVPLSHTVAKTAHHCHGYFAMILAGLVALHTIGALKHHFIDRNDILVRIFKA